MMLKRFSQRPMVAAPSQAEPGTLFLPFPKSVLGLATLQLLRWCWYLLIIDKMETELKINWECFEGKWIWCFHLLPWLSMFKALFISGSKTSQRSCPLDPHLLSCLEEDGERIPTKQPIWLHLGMTSLQNGLKKNGLKAKYDSLICAEMPKLLCFSWIA